MATRQQVAHSPRTWRICSTPLAAKPDEVEDKELENVLVEAQDLSMMLGQLRVQISGQEVEITEALEEKLEHPKQPPLDSDSASAAMTKKRAQAFMPSKTMMNALMTKKKAEWNEIANTRNQELLALASSVKGMSPQRRGMPPQVRRHSEPTVPPIVVEAKSTKVRQAMRLPLWNKELLEQFQRTVTTGAGIDLLERQTSEAEPEADHAHATTVSIDCLNSEESYHATPEWFSMTARSSQPDEADADICSSEVLRRLDNLEKICAKQACFAYNSSTTIDMLRQEKVEASDNQALTTLWTEMSNQSVELAMVRQDLDEQKKEMLLQKREMATVHETLLPLAEQLKQLEWVHETLPALAKQVAAIATSMQKLRCITTVAGDSGGTLTPERRPSLDNDIDDDILDGIVEKALLMNKFSQYIASPPGDPIKMLGSAEEDSFEDGKTLISPEPEQKSFVTLQQLSESCAELQQELQGKANFLESNCKSQHEELRQKLTKFEDELKEIRSLQEMQQSKPYLRLADISACADLTALVGHGAKGPIHHRLRRYSKDNTTTTYCGDDQAGSPSSQTLSLQVPLTALTTEMALSARKMGSDIVSEEEVKELKIETLIENGCHMP